MITRQATFKDFSKLAELVGNTEMIAQWMLYCKDNNNCISLITIDKKKVVAVYLGEFDKNTKGIETLLFIYPEGKENVGKFLLDRASKLFNDVKFVQVLDLFTKHEQYNKMNMKPYQTNYRLELTT